MEVDMSTQKQNSNIMGAMFPELEKVLGTKVSTGALVDVQVYVDPQKVIKRYAEITAERLHRLNPERAKVTALSAEDLYEYYKFLLHSRVSYAGGAKLEYRRIRLLNVPTWMEFALNCVGVVVDRDYGIKFIPKWDESEKVITLDQAFVTSDKLKFFERDGLPIVNTALSKDPEGDLDTMSFCIVDNTVMGRKPDQHVVKSYVAAFLGHKIIDTIALGWLYRIRYDDVNLIAEALMSSEAVWK